MIYLENNYYHKCDFLETLSDKELRAILEDLCDDDPTIRPGYEFCDINALSRKDLDAILSDVLDNTYGYEKLDGFAEWCDEVNAEMYEGEETREAAIAEWESDYLRGLL